MKPVAAIAALELEEIAAGLLATDALLKKAPIAFVRSGTVTRGRWLTLFGGSTAAVEESWREGLFSGGTAVVDDVFLPDVHPRLFAAIAGERRAPGPDALALLETPTACSAILAAELALKGTGVDLLELRLSESGLEGKGTAIVSGDLHEVEAAIDIVSGRLRDALRYRVLPRPHEALLAAVGESTAFAFAPLLPLPGERG